ncbi:MAG TPA: class I SAM-dependent methyltransferase [Terracidiphilus sp.]
MNAISSTLRRRQIVAWGIVSIFVLGFFTPVGAWTGPVLSAWLAGTQRVWRGFVLMIGFALLFGLPQLVRGLVHGGSGGAPAYVGWTMAAVVLSTLPFSFHRLVSPRLPGWFSTLPLPMFGVVFATIAGAWLPAGFATGQGDTLSRQLQSAGFLFGRSAPVFLTYWFAATLMWVWYEESRAARIRQGASLVGAVCVLAAGFAVVRTIRSAALASIRPETSFAWFCFAAAIALSGWALFIALKDRGWECRPETQRILQSPATGLALQLVSRGRSQSLVTSGGERFQMRNHIPDLRRPSDMTGDNQKYNHLYETIGGFYDDMQRIVCACSAMDGDAYVRSYLSPLEVKAGDSVLETSVGTGLNFKYLPAGVSLTGIDLSLEMLANCQAKLRRWGLKGDLFLGNAECLPFADESFDVVFHVGGINFFNDRAKAIREMIRVAKPGSKILIADETEEHVKDLYERGPITSGFYRDRKEAVSAPVDLVPPEMLETHLEFLKPMGKNRFYALTFRKPWVRGEPVKPEMMAVEMVS